MIAVETERLRLRPFEAGDLDPLAAVHASPEFWQYPLRRGQTREETAAFLDARLAAYEERGFDLWAAVRRDTGALIGWIGLSVPTFLPEVLPAVEVGWRLHPDHWGRGYATEGGRAAVRFGFDALGLDRIVSIYEPENVASGRVMQRLGFRFLREARYAARDLVVHVHELTHAHWQARAGSR